MKIIFWVCFALISYAYFGYALWLWLVASLKRRPVARKAITPEISIIIAARNEERNLPEKLENLRNLDYPREKTQVIVASDGSTDNTVKILLEEREWITPVILDESRGKAGALNESIKSSSGEILVFLDARQSVDRDAISELISCFADQTVGAVSGELLLQSEDGTSKENALGIYWKIEKMVRKLESESGSVVGVTGAIYAIRRDLYTEIPSGTILDDVFVPMNVVRKGRRVIFQPSAIARDRIFSEKGKEFSRKVRTLTGNYQLLSIAPWLFSPTNPILFRFLSHKIVRLMVPLFMVGMLVNSALADGLFYRLVFYSQIIFYILAVFGLLNSSVRKLKPIAIVSTFVSLNAAAAIALYNFLARKKDVWRR
ncbi:glycosyltransferase family 2 protein [Granulicella sp. L60]|uniref:glycosyltransferase family 2 protein n=1 Tax=Granulicella sp. L60 TaxID=1641866 RepID=UPI00131ABA39|nr:glycosyltransferase family 2 protein [Granulicella sp. L60]